MSRTLSIGVRDNRRVAAPAKRRPVTASFPARSVDFSAGVSYVYVTNFIMQMSRQECEYIVPVCTFHVCASRFLFFLSKCRCRYVICVSRTRCMWYASHTPTLLSVCHELVICVSRTRCMWYASRTCVAYTNSTIRISVCHELGECDMCHIHQLYYQNICVSRTRCMWHVSHTPTLLSEYLCVTN